LGIWHKLGIWGYHGDHPPHGDRLLTLRRRVPALTVVVDRPDRIHRWYEIVDELSPIREANQQAPARP
jgi:PII-like signaling protein